MPTEDRPKPEAAANNLIDLFSQLKSQRRI